VTKTPISRIEPVAASEGEAANLFAAIAVNTQSGFPQITP